MYFWRYNRMFGHRFSVSLRFLSVPRGRSLNQAYFSRCGIVVPWRVLGVPSMTHLFHASFSRYSKVSCTESQLLGELSSIQVGRPWIKCAFQDTARLLSRESQNIGESSSIKAGCAWIKRTFQDIAMYSRIKYQFPGEFSVFQGVLTWRMPLFQDIPSFLLPEPSFLGKFSSFQVELTCIKYTFQDIASFYSHATNLNFVANILQYDQDAI